ncbi:hypothetical protein [Bacillus sp. JJ1474]|uniref:hypothetical protein n=1 Tax=Bacillus sp. JJ1474 TaxID=3122955 RepID=UPI002FFEE8DC
MRKGLTGRYKRETITDISMLMTEMFEEFMIVKKGEGLAKRTISEHYKNFSYLMNYLGRDLKADEMKTEVFTVWISWMLEEIDYSPMTVNI